MQVIKIKQQEEREIWAGQMQTGKCTAHSLIRPAFCQTVDVAELIFTHGGRTQAKSTHCLGVGLSLALCHVKSPD